MYIPTRWIDTTEVEKAVDEFIKTLGPEVVRVRYNIGEDSTGEPALHFRFVLSDEVSTDAKAFVETARKLRATARRQLSPQEHWGLFPQPASVAEPSKTKSTTANGRKPSWPTTMICLSLRGSL